MLPMRGEGGRKMKGVLVLAKVEQVFKLELSFSVGFAEELELE